MSTSLLRLCLACLGNSGFQLSVGLYVCAVLLVICLCAREAVKVMPLSMRFDSIPIAPTPNESPKQDGVLINSLFDYIMDNVRSNMTTLGRYKNVPIPDLKERVEMTSTSPTMAGTLRASRGSLRDLTTLRRAGDLTLRTEGNTLHVTGVIALRKLSAAFKHYSLQATVFKKSGDLLALEVGKNSFDIHLTICFDKLDCKVRLERISVTKFSDVVVDMTGFSVLNPVSNRVAQWIIHSFQGFIKDIVERYAKALVNNAVKDKELIGRLMGYGMQGMVRGCHKFKDDEDGTPGEANSYCKCYNLGVTITVKPCSNCGNKVVVL